jgi:hypothetical protein
MDEKSESLKSKLADLVLSPGEAQARLKGIFDGREELIKQFRSPGAPLDYANSLLDKAGPLSDDPDDPRVLELAYSYLRAQYLTITFMEMNWYLKNVKDEGFQENALKCSVNLWAAAMSDLFTPQIDSPNATRYFQAEQAKSAREKRSRRPQEQALQLAIKAELGDRVVTSPSKEADAMLSAVNARLSKEGFAPVKKDVIRRRLEK